MTKMREAGLNALAWRQVTRDAMLSPVELDRVIHQRLRDVLASAYEHVPYYREVMRSADYDPKRDYQGPSDLVKLPVTTKQLIKERGIGEFTREGSDLSHCHSELTSGSTGVPLRVYRDPYERALIVAKWLRVLVANGYSLRDRVAALIQPGRTDEGRSVVQRFGFLRRKVIDLHNSSPAEIADTLLNYRPDVLYGTRSNMELVAMELAGRGQQLEGLKFVAPTGEVIFPSTIELFRHAFGCELVESYGSSEGGILAYETPAHDGLHLCEDLTYYEFLDDDGVSVEPGQPGRVVFTDLAGKLMPLIRYDQGDLATIELLSGRGGASQRRMANIIGRDCDISRLPDGSLRPYIDFVLPIKRHESIRQYRVVQRTRNWFRIQIVADAAYFESIREDIHNRFQDEFPKGLTFEIVRVEQLAPGPSGKRAVFMSEVEA